MSKQSSFISTCFKANRSRRVQSKLYNVRNKHFYRLKRILNG